MNLSKKYQLKKHVRIFVLLLGVSVLLWNCEKEGVDIETNASSDFEIKTLNKNQVIKNQKINTFLEKLETQEKLKLTQNYKEKNNNSNINFSIDTQSIKYIEKGEYHSYTFSIIEDDSKSNRVTNLLLSLNKDGEYDS